MAKNDKGIKVKEGKSYTEQVEEIGPYTKKLREQEKIKKAEKEIYLKKFIDESTLSIQELQLQEIREMKKDIHTISTIVLIWFILGLIGLLISVATYFYFTSI